MQILELQESEECHQFYEPLARHFASARDYPLAEKFFIKAGLTREAVVMLTQAGAWEEAHRVASGCMETEERQSMFLGQAQALQSQGNLRAAEKLYVLVGEPELAIAMYKKQKQVLHYTFSDLSFLIYTMSCMYVDGRLCTY